MKRRKRKLKYTVPRIQPLQEMVAEAACAGGSGGDGHCTAGYTATYACQDGIRDNMCVKQSWNCTNGVTPNMCKTGGSPSYYCCKSGTTAPTAKWQACSIGTYPATSCQTGDTKSKLCSSGTSP